MKPSEVPVPRNMQHLPRDERGYPEFYIVFHDEEGKPQFFINDHRKREHVLRLDLCSLCGKKLYRGRWFIGGPMSAFHPNGVYNDPPMHWECAEYALKVCPWLAAPNYRRSVVDSKIGKVKIEQGLAMIDHTMIAGRPAVFVAVMAIGQTYSANQVSEYVKPKKPFRRIQYWQSGVQLPDEVGRQKVLEFLEETPDDYSGVKIPRHSGRSS